MWKWDRSAFDPLNGPHVPLAIKLNFEETNKIAIYTACIAKMEAL